MKQIIRLACCLTALLFCPLLLAQETDGAQGSSRNDGVITTDKMKERLANTQSDGSVITTDKMKERLEGTTAGGSPAAGAFTNDDLGSTGEAEATGEEENEVEAGEDEQDADEAEADAERERQIAGIESELDALAERVRTLKDESDDARIRETESRIEALREAVEALKQGS